MTQRSAQSPVRWLVALIGGAVTAGALAWFLLTDPETGSRDPSAADVAAVAAVAAHAPADRTLRSGETLTIASDALPANRPLLLDLQLGEPSTTDEPLTGRVLTEGRPPLALQGEILGKDRAHTRVQIDSDWLSPGLYIIEIKTTERSHLPLRRYALEVR